MPTTTIRIEDELKARVAAAAQRAGKTALHEIAEARWAKVLATGRTVAWDDARTWLEAKAQGKRSRRPKARVAPEFDTVYILTVRAQREAGFKRQR